MMILLLLPLKLISTRSKLPTTDMAPGKVPQDLILDLLMSVEPQLMTKISEVLIFMGLHLKLRSG